ncbi:MAG: ATP-binding protein [Chloroflexota bacterium]
MSTMLGDGKGFHRQVLRLRWALPVLLFVIVLSYETYEHAILENDLLGFHFSAEILFFGLLGPTLVGLTLNWIARSLEERECVERAARARMEQLNLELEEKVRQRTQSLQEAMAELGRKNEELQQLDRLKSEFVSLVSHELRTPLTNISGGIELILQFGNNLDRPQQEALAIMTQECARLNRLVQGILNVSIIEAGRLCLRLGPIAIPPIVEKAVKNTQVRASGQRFRLPTWGNLPMAWGDEDALAEILLNLLDNAVKYSPNTGEIAIEVKKLEGQEASASAPSLLISVADEGPGIPLGEQIKIFEKFHRVDSGDDRKTYGYGLGLYVTRKLVEAQGGRIWVESKPQAGARFNFTLPLARLGNEEDPPD